MTNSRSKTRPLIVGISGVSSSGKTTLARLLRAVWPGSLILHQDDFYRPDNEIPVKDGVQDWDCLESIDFAKFRECLLYVRGNKALPPGLESKEDKNEAVDSGLSESDLEPFRQRSRELLGDGSSKQIVLVDGFLLYSQNTKMIWELLDVRLLLTADFQTVKARREARSGYVTLEGFWEDPPGYVDDVVWPNYVKEHAYLFQGGDVEGSLENNNATKLGIRALGSDSDMKPCLSWAYDIVHGAIVEELRST